MQVKKNSSSDTQAVVHVTAVEKELTPLKEHVLGHFQGKVKVAGFRAGKVPAGVLEKHVDPNVLQTEFLEEAIEQLYVAAVNELKLRPVDRPQISIKKFVPFSTLEFEASIPVIGEIKLPDYTKIKKARPDVKITDKDVKEVIESLRGRLAEKKDVNRPAKDGDQVFIDFQGADVKGQPIKGTEGKDYPLVIGSKSFIPGFEENMIGLGAGDEKTFDLKFPEEYGATNLAGQKVTFTVNVTKVQEVVEAKVDDAFASKAGPFKTVAELKADIKKQLAHERKHQADREFESELVKHISDKSKVAIPEVLINDQVERLLQDLKRNLVYRGQTLQEFLEAEGKTEEQYRKDVLAKQAEDRVKASLVLAEIADKEKIDVTPEELEIRMQLLKGQYQDPKMQEELNKPEARRDIAARLLTEKTVHKLVAYATGK